MNCYDNEIMPSRFGYPEGYEPKPIVDQIILLGKIFDLDSNQALDFAKHLPASLPSGAEGWFAVPKVSAVAKKFFPDVLEKNLRYCEVTKLAIAKLTSVCELSKIHFFNALSDEIVPGKLRQSALSLYAWMILEKEQPGDILIIPAQYGLRHRGSSGRRALEIMSNSAREFGLGVFSLACINICHPERYQSFGELEPVCIGDEFSREADGDFSEAPSFFFFNSLMGVATGCEGRLTLGSDSKGSYSQVFGPASFFVD